MFFVFFTMLFNGGMVPTYLMYIQLFDIKNTYWALLFPHPPTSSPSRGATLSGII